MANKMQCEVLYIKHVFNFFALQDRLLNNLTFFFFAVAVFGVCVDTVTA